MNDNRAQQAEEILDRAVDELHRSPVPPGPPPEKLRAVLLAGQQGREYSRPKTFRERIFKMNRIAAAAAAIVIVAGIVGVWMWASGGPEGKGAAWAAVQARLRQVETMTCTITMEQEGQPGFELKMMFKEGGLMRQEVSKPARAVNIMNLKQGKMISLLPGEKKAITIDLTALPEEVRKQKEEENFLDEMKKLIEKSETPLGERQIAGKTTRGYEVDCEGQRLSIWVDADTAEPIEMEMKMFQGKMRLTMSDFALDQPLDDSLFSLEIPEGYEVAGQMKLSEATAEDVAALLEIWAKMRGGTFPDGVTPQDMMQDMQAAGKPPSDELAMRFGELAARVFILQADPKRNVHYTGKGLKPGEKDKPIFWFLPAGAEKYKVIYADLSIADVAEEDLPNEAEQNADDRPQPQETAPEPAPAAE